MAKDGMDRHGLKMTMLKIICKPWRQLREALRESLNKWEGPSECLIHFTREWSTLNAKASQEIVWKLAISNYF